MRNIKKTAMNRKNWYYRKYFIIFTTAAFSLLFSTIGLRGSYNISRYQSEAGPSGYSQQEFGSDRSDSTTNGPLGDAQYTYRMGIIKAFYSSHKGWTIGTTSRITRETKWGVPEYNDNDIYLLDGTEMVYASGTNPKLYHLSKDNFIRIEYHNPNTSNSYWKVTLKDGTVITYGNTYDSRIIAIGKADTQPRVWAVCNTHDIKFNEAMYYIYEEDSVNGVNYLHKLVYGKTNASQYGYSGIRLYYEDKDHYTPSYRSGSKVINAKRVKSVLLLNGCDKWGNSTEGEVSAYKIDWITSYYTGVSLIRKITQYGSDVLIDRSSGAITGGSIFNITSFTYPDASIEDYGFRGSTQWGEDHKFFSNSITGRWEWSFSSSGYKRNIVTANFVDINGDNIPEILHDFTNEYKEYGMSGSPLLNPYYGVHEASIPLYPVRYNRDIYDTFHNETFIHLNNGYEFLEEIPYGSAQWSYLSYSSLFSEYINVYPYDVIYKGAKTHSVCLDMNGDGKVDKICWNYHAPGQKTATHIISYGDENGFSSEKLWLTPDEFSQYTPLRKSLLRFKKWVPGVGHVDIEGGPIHETKIDLIDINGDGLPDYID